MKKNIIKSIIIDRFIAPSLAMLDFICETLQYCDDEEIEKLLKFADEGYKSKWVKANFNPNRNKSNKKQVKDLETGITYETQNDCAKAIGKSQSYISNHKERFVSTSKSLEKLLKFADEVYKSKWVKANFKPKRNQSKKKQSNKKQVKDLKTGITYESHNDCAKAIGKSSSYISNHKERFVSTSKSLEKPIKEKPSQRFRSKHKEKPSQRFRYLNNDLETGITYESQNDCAEAI